MHEMFAEWCSCSKYSGILYNIIGFVAMTHTFGIVRSGRDPLAQWSFLAWSIVTIALGAFATRAAWLWPPCSSPFLRYHAALHAAYIATSVLTATWTVVSAIEMFVLMRVASTMPSAGDEKRDADEHFCGEALPRVSA